MKVTFRIVDGVDVPEPLSVRAFDVVRTTEHHVGSLDGRGVVLVTLDPFPDQFTLTEIQVLREERGRGIGAAALAYAEGVARARARTSITLRPKPLDFTTDAGQLTAWYERAGYVANAERTLWTKQL